MADQNKEQNEAEVNFSRGFFDWLKSQNMCLAFTTYQAGKFFIVGKKSDKELVLNNITLPRCMGMAVDRSAHSMYLSSIYQIHRFVNQIGTGQNFQGHDRLFLPRVTWSTGDLDPHDMTILPDGRLAFVSTMFSCICTLSEDHSFTPYWTPPFISKLAPEDRCHLNGLAADESGRPKYATAFTDTDLNEAWRDHAHHGGVLIDIEKNEIVCRGLSMPHSPRLYRDRLWILNSGTGYFGYVDLKAGQFEPVLFCPGYIRGLAFADKYAIIGLSKHRQSRTLQTTDLLKNMEKHKVSPRCAINVVDLDTGNVMHNIMFQGYMEELYDIKTLPGVINPQIIGYENSEIMKMYSVGDK